MKQLKPTIEEQIEAIVHHKAYELVMNYSGVDRVDKQSYEQVFTVKRSEILAYIRNKYDLNDLIPRRSDIRDGFYAIPVSDGYRIYEQYDGHRTPPEDVAGKDILQEKYVDYLLRSSGTGLNFE